MKKKKCSLGQSQPNIQVKNPVFTTSSGSINGYASVTMHAMVMLTTFFAPNWEGENIHIGGKNSVCLRRTRLRTVPARLFVSSVTLMWVGTPFCSLSTLTECGIIATRVAHRNVSDLRCR